MKNNISAIDTEEVSDIVFDNCFRLKGQLKFSLK